MVYFHLIYDGVISNQLFHSFVLKKSINSSGFHIHGSSIERFNNDDTGR